MRTLKAEELISNLSRVAQLESDREDLNPSSLTPDLIIFLSTWWELFSILCFCSSVDRPDYLIEASLKVMFLPCFCPSPPLSPSLSLPYLPNLSFWTQPLCFPYVCVHSCPAVNDTQFLSAGHNIFLWLSFHHSSRKISVAAAVLTPVVYSGFGLLLTLISSSELSHPRPRSLGSFMTLPSYPFPQSSFSFLSTTAIVIIKYLHISSLFFHCKHFHFISLKSLVGGYCNFHFNFPSSLFRGSYILARLLSDQFST